MGPVDDATLQDLARQGVIRDDTLIWTAGMAAWEPYGKARAPRETLPPPAPLPAPLAAPPPFTAAPPPGSGVVSTGPRTDVGLRVGSYFLDVIPTLLGLVIAW